MKHYYIDRRKSLSTAYPDSLIVISAHSALQYSADLAFPFRQDSNFLYLTGLKEPDMVLVIDTDTQKSYILFPDLNEYKKDWDGESDHAEIKKISGVDEILPRSDLGKLVKKALKNGKKIGYLKPLEDRVEPYGFYSNPARKLLEIELIATGSYSVQGGREKHLRKSEFVDIRGEIAKLRMVKSEEEIKFIQKTIDATGKALKETKTRLGDFKTEKEIEKALTISFLQNGADMHGFEPIVASGQNAATIHYKSNDSRIESNSLILLDVGAQIGEYSADISRTWAFGKPTDRQKRIYDEVLKVQEKVISAAKPGVTIGKLQKVCNLEIAKSCKSLEIEEKELPHGVSHHLGLDVHDAADYKSELKPGMVITVEPGIYLKDEGIGVRIEDIVLITKNGCKVLSKDIPKML